MDGLPEYRVYNAYEHILCKYRFEDDDLLGFGPYTPYKSIPFFIIWGEGLPVG